MSNSKIMELEEMLLLKEQYLEELEAKNGELEKKLEAVEMVHSNYVNVSCDLYSTLEKKLEIVMECLEYYGSTDNWQETPNRNNLYQMIGNDVSDDFDDALRFGGKRAREALSKIKSEGL